MPENLLLIPWFAGILYGSIPVWLEERELVKRFGASYLEYRKSVPLMPRSMSNSYQDNTHAGAAQPARKP